MCPMRRRKMSVMAGGGADASSERRAEEGWGAGGEDGWLGSGWLESWAMSLAQEDSLPPSDSSEEGKSTGVRRAQWALAALIGRHCSYQVLAMRGRKEPPILRGVTLEYIVGFDGLWPLATMWLGATAI